jgi:uncharacterized protein YqfA (UPF0365 family)
MTSSEQLLELTICFILLIAIAAYIPFDIWMKVKINKIRLSLVQLTIMRFKRIDINTIVTALIIARKNQIIININTLEMHHLSGGNIIDVVEAAAIYKKIGYDKSIAEILTSDLHGNDVIEEANRTNSFLQ